MAAKLPKLQLPKDEAAQRQLSEASEVARSGELKSAQQMLKEGVASGLFPAPLQRQVLAWWSAGEYDLLSSEAKEKPKAVAKVNNMEEQVVKLMRENKWSRKEAVKYIDEGGLDMDAMRAEMNAPMDDMFDKLKKNGPPQWFVDAMTSSQEAKAAKEGEFGPAPEPVTES
ncbi:unnamed protein product [Effrenium voratum]|nr:unnamed protein product [Effrenium voratum]